MRECIFCKIINKEIPTQLLKEGKRFLAFDDINPKAPVHILIVSRQHVPSVRDLNSDGLVEELVLAAKEVAKEKNLEGYKLVFNVGRAGGQIIDHLHLHLLGGWKEKPGGVEV